MPKTKLKRYGELAHLPNVIEWDRDKDILNNIKGNWHCKFKRIAPLILELGCGKGEYSIELSQREPQNNYIGIDINGYRIWKGATYAQTNHIENVLFLRAYIDYIDHYFDEEVSKIWIPFPDPYRTQTQMEKKGLTSLLSLQRYKRILKFPHEIHFKTDCKELFEYTINNIEKCGGNIIENIQDLHTKNSNDMHIKNISTYYEKKFREAQRPIYYLFFSL